MLVKRSKWDFFSENCIYIQMSLFTILIISVKSDNVFFSVLFEDSNLKSSHFQCFRFGCR